MNENFPRAFIKDGELRGVDGLMMKTVCNQLNASCEIINATDNNMQLFTTYNKLITNRASISLNFGKLDDLPL